MEGGLGIGSDGTNGNGADGGNYGATGIKPAVTDR